MGEWVVRVCVASGNGRFLLRSGAGPSLARRSRGYHRTFSILLVPGGGWNSMRAVMANPERTAAIVPTFEKLGACAQRVVG